MTAASAVMYRRPVRKAPALTNVRAARTAAHARRKRTAALRHQTILRAAAALVAMTAVVALYLFLQDNVTRLNYDLARAGRERDKLVVRTTALDDQIARLESRDRLAAVAAGLGMHDAGSFVVATIPAATAAERPRGIALLSFTHWLR